MKTKNILICLSFLFLIGCSNSSDIWNSIVEDSKSSNVFKIEGEGKYIVRKDDNSVWLYFNNDLNMSAAFSSKIMIFPPTK
jgi:hypothetical protein